MSKITYLATPTSWPRRATPCDLVPRWAGEFRSHGDWVSFATHRLTGVRGSVGEEVKAICVDAFGRRCNIGADFKRAESEGAFPVRYFWECEPSATPENVHGTDLRQGVTPTQHEVLDLIERHAAGWSLADGWEAKLEFAADLAKSAAAGKVLRTVRAEAIHAAALLIDAADEIGRLIATKAPEPDRQCGTAQ